MDIFTMINIHSSFTLWYYFWVNYEDSNRLVDNYLYDESTVFIGGSQTGV